jgi:D-alanyl-D-alanine carboxypeptidase/D-alanyl-D-alanine-endopeptidase (penicillin-binding protein 4)
MKLKLIILALFFSFNFLFLNSQNSILNPQISTISYEVVNLKSGEVVASQNPMLCATPASVTKIITTATALELLGGDFQFSTYIETNGTIDNGVLNGDLIIRGGADPTLGSIHLGDRAFLDYFIKVIKHKGINHITGDVIIDPTCLDRCAASVKWIWEDMGFHYGAAAFGLSAYDNTSIITMNSGDFGTKPIITSVWPETPNLAIYNEVKTLSIPNDSVWAFCQPYGLALYLQGGMPVNRNNYVVRTSIPNPSLVVAKSLHKMLGDYGVKVDGDYSVQTEYFSEQRTLIYEYKSRKLREIIRLTNYKSNNLYAEHIFRRLGNIIMPNEATSSASIQVIKDYWAKQGVDVSALFLYDGCGLAAQNAYSAHFLNQILIHMRKSSNWDDFYQSLPRAGREGTVGSFLYKTKLQDIARLKSGSLSGVQCYSGYIMHGDKEYAVTVMVNNFTCKRKDVKKQIEEWLLDVVK